MRFKVYLGYLFLSLLILVVIFQAAFLVLPSVVKTMIDPLIQKQLPQKLPLGLVPGDLKFTIEKIGLTHTLLGRIHIGKLLSADCVDFQYGFKELKRFELEKITVSGLTLYAQVDADKKLRLNGQEFPGKIKAAQEDEAALKDGDALKDRDEKIDLSSDFSSGNLDRFLSFLPKQVVLKKANLSIKTGDHEVIVPFEILSSLDTAQKKAVLTARLHPFGQTVQTIIAGTLAQGIERIHVQAPAFHPEVLSGIFPEIKRFHLSGPLDIDILKKIDSDWQLSVSQVMLDLPNFPGTSIKDFTASVGKRVGKITAVGNFELSGSQIPAMGMQVDLNFTQKENTSPLFDLTLKNKKMATLSLAGETQKISLGHPGFLLKLKGNLLRQTGNFSFDCKNLRATRGKERLLVKKVLIKSVIKGDFSHKGKGVEVDLKSDLSQIEVSVNTGQANVAKADVAGVTLSGHLGITKQFSPRLHLDTKIKEANLRSGKFKTRIFGINATLPLVVPFVDTPKPGSFSIREIGYDDQFTGRLRGYITQSRLLGVAFGGQASIDQLDGVNLGFEGRAGGGDSSAMIDFRVDPFLLVPAHMGKILPSLSFGENSSVKVSSKGRIEYSDHAVNSRAEVIMDGGDLYFPDMNLFLGGMAGRIEFNDLMVPESIPGQMLTIDKITANQFEFENVNARFSIEDGQSVNIENLRFNWCNGLVSTESIRLPGKDNKLLLTLYCDRLELSGLLKQMGAFHAEGEGALSGRIPVVYSNGNVSFDKGFLFSTPGTGGRVVIEDTQRLTAGIPMDTPEFVQLDLAREALKDFDYQWAKLELNTFEDTLSMNMELDGKPARLLPFEYQKEVGSFVRVDAQSPGSKFQGIKLNVNLKLPFNQVLKFGNNLNSILNQ